MALPPALLKADPAAVTGIAGCNSPFGKAAGTTCHQISHEGLNQTLLPGDPDSRMHINPSHTAGEIQILPSMTSNESLSLPGPPLSGREGNKIHA